MINPKAKRPVVFLDRDGTLNQEVGYIFDVNQLVLVPGAAQAVFGLNSCGIACVVVTNQSGPARGLFPESHVVALNSRLVTLLNEEGSSIDAVYYCPHHVDGVVAEYAIACNCRKPKIGMIERAFNEHPEFDRTCAYMVGDQSTDIGLARNANLKAVLVKTGFGAAVHAGEFQWKVEPDFLAASIVEAAQWIVEDIRAQAYEGQLRQY